MTRINVTVDGVSYVDQVDPAAAGALPTRDHRKPVPHWLRHHQLRRLHGSRQRRVGEELHSLLAAQCGRGAEITTVEGLAGRTGRCTPSSRASGTSTACSAATAPPACS